MLEHIFRNTKKINKKKKKCKYSINTSKPNQKPLYSVEYPIINSVSASTRSKGALCNRNKSSTNIKGQRIIKKS